MVTAPERSKMADIRDPLPLEEALAPTTPVLLESGARTASGAGTGQDLRNDRELIVTLDVAAASGTAPTLDVKLEHSPDNSKWGDLGTAFIQQAGVGRETKTFTQFHRYVRVSYTIGGTGPSFTFSVEATARP